MADDKKIGKSVSGDALTKLLEKAKGRVRAAHGQLEEGERGEYSGLDSFRGTLDLTRNPGRGHALSTHFYSSTAAYELMRKFEWWAQKYPRDDRFVFASVSKLLKNFLKGDPENKESRSRSGFWKAMALLQKLGALSPRILRDGREGYVVAPHAALCVESDDGKRCDWIGPTQSAYRKKLGLVGWFVCVPGGWMWQRGELKLDE
jgi:hypothetical protein